MSTPAFKTLHSFTVTVQREVTESSTREENGQRITVESKSTKDVPYTILLKEPSRRERQDLTLFQGIAYNEAIDKGLLPRVMVQQKLSRNDQASLSGADDKALLATQKRILELSNEYMLIVAVGDKATSDQVERKEKLLLEFTTLQRKAIDLNEAYQSVYAYTAESYMQNKTLLWLTLFLTYVKATPDAKPEPLFAGSTFVAKEDRAGDMDDTQDPVYVAVNATDERIQMPRLASYWGLYLFNRAGTPDEFRKIEEEWDKEAKARAEAIKAAEPVTEVKTESQSVNEETPHEPSQSV